MSLCAGCGSNAAPHVCSIAHASARFRTGARDTSGPAASRALVLPRLMTSPVHAPSASSCGVPAAVTNLLSAGFVLRTPDAFSGAARAVALLDSCTHDAWPSAQDVHPRFRIRARRACRNSWASCRWLRREPGWLASQESVMGKRMQCCS